MQPHPRLDSDADSAPEEKPRKSKRDGKRASRESPIPAATSIDGRRRRRKHATPISADSAAEESDQASPAEDRQRERETKKLSKKL